MILENEADYVLMDLVAKIAIYVDFYVTNGNRFGRTHTRLFKEIQATLIKYRKARVRLDPVKIKKQTELALAERKKYVVGIR